VFTVDASTTDPTTRVEKLLKSADKIESALKITAHL
jgi:hypothetical protein